MKAYVLTESGPAFQERDPPRPGPTEVLVRVRAAALNRVDLAMAQGHVHGGAGGLGNVLGVEWAGEVVDAGPEAGGLKPGDRVMGSGAGAFAEYALGDGSRISRLPDANLDFETAATLPTALQTMHDAIVTHGALKSGDAVLIHGASSGVGLMGLRIARAMGARLVVGTSTNEGRRSKLSEYGADLALDPQGREWVDEVLSATDGRGVDLAVDQVSGPGFNSLMRATKITGRIVNVGRLGGERADFNFDLHALRRITFEGVTFRTRSRAEVTEIVRRMREDLWPHLEAGRLALPIDSVFDFDQLPEALSHMRANAHFGKIVVRVG